MHVPHLEHGRRLLVEAPVIWPRITRLLVLGQVRRKVDLPRDPGEPMILVRRVRVRDDTVIGRAAMRGARVAQAGRALVENLLLDEWQLVEGAPGVFGRAQLADVLRLVEREEVDVER